MKITSKSLTILRFFSFHFAPVSDCMKKSGNSRNEEGVEGVVRFAAISEFFQQKKKMDPNRLMCGGGAEISAI